jgi:hypothetical protein
MAKHSKYYYDTDRNIDSSRGVNVTMCRTCKTCPSINIHKDLDKVILGGEDEGFSVWTKEQFEIMIEEIKKGTFDGYIKKH